ncbi:unnamed protein product [Peniophora sp. CBMAI 1063]|nr:unnamed protein product [Peniophora sp. CBMAI 1063]
MSTWISILAFLTVIQTIVWRDSADTSIAPILCDLSIRVQVGEIAAGPACAFIIARSLYLIIRHPTWDYEDRRRHRRTLALNLFLVIGLPIIINVQYYTVQNSRFQVFEQLGCTFNWQSSGLAVIMLGLIPVVLSIASIMYLVSVAATLWKHKRNMSHLFVSHTSITPSLYIRILAFGLILLIDSGIFIGNLFPPPTGFYPGWNVVHGNWSPEAIPAAEWQTQSVGRLTVVWNGWINVWLAAIVFGLFVVSRSQTHVMSRCSIRVC